MQPREIDLKPVILGLTVIAFAVIAPFLGSRLVDWMIVNRFPMAQVELFANLYILWFIIAVWVMTGL